MRVTFAAGPREAVIASFGDLLHKSFENILRNALTHTARDSEVKVELQRVKGCYQVLIEDHGPGVPEAELDKLFDEFYRVDTARARESGGYGLGLSIARRAILRHGGDVEARNSRSGLLITVRLPCND